MAVCPTCGKAQTSAGVFRANQPDCWQELLCLLALLLLTCWPEPALLGGITHMPRCLSQGLEAWRTVQAEHFVYASEHLRNMLCIVVTLLRHLL